jgi:hypothetical protein
MHFEKSTTCLTRVYTKNAGEDLEGESSESMTASQETLSCLRACDSPSTSRQREISSESSGRHERGEDKYAANNIEPAEGLCHPYASVGGDDTVWAESTVGDYSVQEASDHEDSDVSLTTMHSRLQKLVFDHVDNEAGLVIVDFGSTDGREMKRKLVVRSIFYYLP